VTVGFQQLGLISPSIKFQLVLEVKNYPEGYMQADVQFYKTYDSETRI